MRSYILTSAAPSCSRTASPSWDVLASCTIAGASDASIDDARPNDIARILDAAPIELVCTTGGKASALCHRFFGELLKQRGIEQLSLPSTSSANARMRLDDLVRAYRPLCAHLGTTA